MNSVQNFNEFYTTFLSVSFFKTTNNEIKELINQHHLPIIFYDNEDAYYDEVGGFHQEKEDYDCNPFGVQCVNCTRISCAKCERRYIKDE